MSSHQVVSPSRLAIAALGLAPEGAIEADREEHCAVCGGPIHPGELMDELSLPDTFTNHDALLYRGEQWCCGACTAVMSNASLFQLKLASGCFNAEAFYPISKTVNRAWMLLEPPDPPFAMVIQNGKQQHTIWRAPVSLSRDSYWVRIGEQVLHIRRKKLIEAREAAMRLNDLWQDYLAEQKAKKVQRARKPKASTKRMMKPFTASSGDFCTRKFKGVNDGQLSPWLAELLRNGKASEADSGPLQCLTSGEVWALDAVLNDAEKPEPITTKE